LRGTLRFDVPTFPAGTVGRCGRTFPTFPGGVSARGGAATFEDKLPALCLMLHADSGEP
jgi:hypothetical protein